MFAALAACGHETTTPRAPIASVVQVALDLRTIGPGDKGHATATVLDAHGHALAGRSIAWRSSNPGVASIDVAGTVTGVSAGVTTISATSDTASGSAILTVVSTLPNVKIDNAHLTQGIQRYATTIPLMAGGNPAMVRVFGHIDRPFPIGSRVPRVRVELFKDTTRVAIDESDLTGYVYATSQVIHEVIMPAALVQPGLGFRVTFNPDGNPPEQSLADNIYPPRQDSIRAVDVRVMKPLRLHFVPLIMPPYVDADITNSNLPDVLSTVRQVMPVSGIAATIGQFFAAEWRASLGDAGAWSYLLSQIDALRLSEGSKDYYVAVAGPGNGASGAGWIGSDPLDYGPGTHSLGLRGTNAQLAHELGHNMGRKHAPCGSVIDPDLNYPYEGGYIGVVTGEDMYTYAVTGTFPTEKPSLTTFDFMGNCTPRWVSDYTWDGLLSWRTLEDAAAAQARAVALQECLIVWGAVTGDSIHLEPSFVMTARPSLPQRSGTFQLAATSVTGGSLFSFSFDPTQLDLGARRFMFAVPVTQADRNALARVTITGEGKTSVRARMPPSFALSALAANAAPRIAASSANRTTITWDTVAAPLLVVRDAASGRLLGMSQAGRLTVAANPTTLQIVLSDGLRSAATSIAR